MVVKRFSSVLMSILHKLPLTPFTADMRLLVAMCGHSSKNKRLAIWSCSYRYLWHLGGTCIVTSLRESGEVMHYVGDTRSFLKRYKQAVHAISGFKRFHYNDSIGEQVVSRNHEEGLAAQKGMTRV